jgi:hypothetical protein
MSAIRGPFVKLLSESNLCGHLLKIEGATYRAEIRNLEAFLILQGCNKVLQDALPS